MSDLTKRIKQAAKQLQSIPTIEDGTSTTDSDPNRILAAAYDNLDEVVIAGTDKNGDFWFSSSVADGGSVLWIIEHLKLQLLGIKSNIDNTIDDIDE